VELLAVTLTASSQSVGPTSYHSGRSSRCSSCGVGAGGSPVILYGMSPASPIPAFPFVLAAALMRPVVLFRKLAPVIRPEPSALTAGVAGMVSEFEDRLPGVR
jgi:hypothetical protein